MFHDGGRRLIINADDLGLSAANNEAILILFEQCAITSASLMVPCAAAKEAAEACVRQGVGDVGIHLTLTSTGQERLRPVYRGGALHTLTTSEGYFPYEASELEQQADPVEVRLELQAQIEQALAWGVTPTHLDSHAGSVLGLYHGRDFLDIVFELCETYRLPFNLPTRIVEQPFLSESHKARFRLRLDDARRRGLPLIDDLISLPYRLPDSQGYEEARTQMIELLRALQPGITQWTVHPAKAPHPSQGRERELEYRLLLDPLVRQTLEEEGVHLIGWAVV